MKKHLLALACAGALLAACKTPSAGVASVEVQADHALYIAEAAFKGASVGLDTAVKTGVLHGQPAAVAKVDYDKAHDALVKARKAKTLLDFAGELAAAQLATSAAGSVQSQLPQ